MSKRTPAVFNNVGFKSFKAFQQFNLKEKHFGNRFAWRQLVPRAEFLSRYNKIKMLNVKGFMTRLSGWLHWKNNFLDK